MTPSVEPHQLHVLLWGAQGRKHFKFKIPSKEKEMPPFYSQHGRHSHWQLLIIPFPVRKIQSLTCSSFPGPQSHCNALSASAIRYRLTNQVGDSWKKYNKIKFITDGRAASADAVRQSTKAPRLEIVMIPTDTNVYVLHNMKPLYLGCASSSTNTCMGQKQHCSKAKFPFTFVVLLKILRCCRQRSGVH